MIFDRRSLQFRLVWQLTALFAVAAVIVVASVAWQAWVSASSLDAREVDRQVEDLSRAVVAGPNNRPTVRLSPDLAALFGSPRYQVIFAVRDASGALIDASPPALGALAATWPAATREPTFFRLQSFGPAARNYSGVTRLRESAAGPVMISVAVIEGADAFIHAVLEEFLFDVAWIIPIVLGLTLLIAVVALRRGLRPLYDLSNAAARIGPRDAGIRLPVDGLPSELLPLAQAFNQALTRLDEGIGLLRRFTANAAHELRTPLAVLTVEIERLEHNGRLARLREDVERMNRLVDQLLQVARLDNVALDISQNVDLNRVAAEVVGQLAPLAIADGKTVGLTEAPEPVIVQGNTQTIADALRNLVENAIGHTAAKTEVEVTVHACGRIAVADRGPGVPPESRDRIFERFWRGDRNERAGAGLGLAIVREIMHAHHGEVTVENSSRGGALFTLIFPTAKAHRDKVDASAV